MPPTDGYRRGVSWDLFAEARREVRYTVHEGRLQSFGPVEDVGVAARSASLTGRMFVSTNTLDQVGLAGFVSQSLGLCERSAGGAAEMLRRVTKPEGTAGSAIGSLECEGVKVVAALRTAHERATEALDGASTDTFVSSRLTISRRAVLSSDAAFAEYTLLRGFVTLGTRPKSADDATHVHASQGWSGPFRAAELETERLVSSAGRRVRCAESCSECTPLSVPMVLSGRAFGVLVHEAIGHGLEADHIASGSVSAASIDRLGGVAAELSVADDPTNRSAYGAFAYDDEGSPAEPIDLVRNGRSVGVLGKGGFWSNDIRGSAGRARRASYRDPPLPRMTHTRVSVGSADEADMVASIARGMYIASLSAGSVNLLTGACQMGIEEAYQVEGGKITTPLRRCRVSVSGPGLLSRIHAIGGLPEYAAFTCGKAGQWVPVSVSAPSVLIAPEPAGHE